MKILVVGCWHLGSVFAASLAKSNHEVYLFDQREEIAKSWREGRAPLYEPGLQELISTYWGKSLHFTPDLQRNLPQMDLVLIAYDTPIDEEDRVDLTDVRFGFESLLHSPILHSRINVLITSQLPAGTSRAWAEELEKNLPSWQGYFIYHPENLQLGTALQSFNAPDRVVFGFHHFDPNLKNNYLQFIKDTFQFDANIPIELFGLGEAEMIKHALNAFLGLSVIFGNEIANRCEEKKINAWEVLMCLRKDRRVGPKAFILPGLGFAGGTIGRDLQTLGGDFFSYLWHKNAERFLWIKNLLLERLGNSLKDKKILLLGITYKVDTNTLRQSPALQLAKLLESEGAQCVATDPGIQQDELPPSLPFQFLNLEHHRELFQGASAAILLTEWRQFRELPWPELEKIMNTNLIIDTKNALGLPKAIVPGKIL